MSKKILEEEDPPPEDLPVAKTQQAATAQAPANAMAAARTCDKCQSTNVRIISNYSGQRAICGNCKHWWSLSMAAPMVVPGGIYDRGLSRRTVVDPNYDLAFEDLDETFDPKKP